MKHFNVHIYREMRLFFPGIEAANANEAAGHAATFPTEDAEYTEDCDGETFSAMVDVIGDEDFSRSVTIDFKPERLRKAAPVLIEALKAAADWIDAQIGVPRVEIQELVRAVIETVTQEQADRGSL